MGCVDIQLATSSAMIFQSILFGPESKVSFETYGEKPDLLERLVEKLWYFSFVWSVGGSCQAQDHEKFDDFAKELMETSGAPAASLHAVAATRVHERMVSFSTLSCFGPSRATAMLRA